MSTDPDRSVPDLNLRTEEVRHDPIDVALDGQQRPIDLVRITVDDRPPEHFAVMAGIGIDAMIMDETNEDLKDKVGWSSVPPRPAAAPECETGDQPIRNREALVTDPHLA